MRQLYRKTHLNTFKWVLRNYTDEIAHLKMDNPNMTAGCLKYIEILNPCIRTDIFQFYVLFFNFSLNIVSFTHN